MNVTDQDQLNAIIAGVISYYEGDIPDSSELQIEAYRGTDGNLIVYLTEETHNENEEYFKRLRKLEKSRKKDSRQKRKAQSHSTNSIQSYEKNICTMARHFSELAAETRSLPAGLYKDREVKILREMINEELQKMRLKIRVSIMDPDLRNKILGLLNRSMHKIWF